jgi:D,D-heptose 1,7-bisphosphate phosphatase
MNAAVFLDRDNTLIHNDGDLGDPAKVRLMQGAASAVASLCGLGYKVVVITNQGGVARGKYTEEDVDAVHERLSALLAAGANGAKIDRYYYCPYHPEGTVSRYRKEHPNRKPSPGMLWEAARELGLDMSQSWTIGDQVRDVQAGLAAGTRAILLRRDADRLKPFDPREHPGLDAQEGEEAEPNATPDFYARNLVEAVRIVAQQRKPETSEQINRGGPKQRKWDAAAVAKLQRKRAGDEGKSGEASGAVGVISQGETKPFRPWNVPTAELDDQPDENTGEISAVTTTPTKTDVSEDTLAVNPQPGGVGEPVKQVEAVEATPVADEKTLRLILQELRHQRGTGADFSYVRIMAIVLQTVAGACLLGAFWMGGGDEVLFLRLIGSAVVVQLAVIAALLWDR